MRLQKTGIVAILQPIRALLGRFAVVSLMAVAFALMFMGKAEVVLVDRTRAAVVSAAAPFLDALSRPIATVVAGYHYVTGLTDAYNENQVLKAELARLHALEQTSAKLASENAMLRDLTRFVPDASASFVSARVIGEGGGPFVRSVLINAGARDGLARGQAVVNGDGLVGRLTDVGDGASRVLLLTDLNSRVPVVIEETRERAILAGDNSDRPALAYLPPDARIANGQRVVTSGNGGVLPAGLQVGTVVLGRDGVPRVQPYVSWSRIEFVRIVDFGLEVEELPPIARQPAKKAGKAQ
ncbi:MAG: rod shape-determining protein MreC [Gemmatimonas sp.]